MAKAPNRIGVGQRITAKWLNALLNFAVANQVKGSETINVNNLPGGATVRVNESALRRTGGSTGGDGDAYDSFFKVSNVSDAVDNRVVVSDGLIVLGLETYEVQFLSLVIENSGWAYLEITSTGSVYNFDLKLTDDIEPPEQLINEYNVVLAYVEYTAPVLPATIGSIVVTQHQFGEVRAAGRLF